jgi:hypothetical protein
MKLQQYIESKTNGKVKKIPADTIAKWTARNGAAYATQGAAGAQVYMSQYAKTAAAPKVIDLGRLALETGNMEFAGEFFKRAAELERVQLEVSDTGNSNPVAAAITAVQSATVEAAINPAFPSGAQPGKFAPMQPVDGVRDQAHYVGAPSIWGQPKKDGNKLIVFVTPDQVYYQSRQMKLNPMPSVQMDNELRNAARVHGSFICEGELTFLSCTGSEHRTASQAQRFNAKLGHGNILPVMKYYIFNCVWREHQMLRTYGDMVMEGHMLGSYIKDVLCSEIIEPVLVAKTTAEKAELINVQKNEGREGEVWFIPLQPYVPGKVGQSYVRTKYGEEFTCLAVGFTETTAPEFAFGAMQIQSLDGKDLGSVGTGFTLEDRRCLLAHYQEHGPFMVQVYSRGFTEDRKAWLPTFVDFTD